MPFIIFIHYLTKNQKQKHTHYKNRYDTTHNTLLYSYSRLDQYTTSYFRPRYPQSSTSRRLLFPIPPVVTFTRSDRSVA
jgi:hypothetical protein